MINTENNPEYLNSFLQYQLAYKRKSPESVNQYNCDLTMFLRYMKYHFGLTKEINESVKLGFQSGLITSASIITNTEHFCHAVDVVLPQIKNIDLGFHFNIVEGKSLTHPSLLCDDKGFFNNSYVDLLFKMNNKNVLLQMEQEFEAQIERILKYHEISHLDSHVHIHSIPSIFKLFIKMAKKYNIKYIRLQKEIPYCIIRKSLNKKYMINIIKNILCFVRRSLEDRRAEKAGPSAAEAPVFRPPVFGG